jgi:RHS repeat-associated protein
VWNRGEIYAAGRHIATYDNLSSPTTYFVHSDWLGTERVRSTVSGSSCESIISLPFGDGESTSGTCGDPSTRHFTGKERDTESNLDNFGARYYSSMMGRFLSPDSSNVASPVPYAQLGVPQSLNLYGYVENNPLSRTDPDGHCTVDDETHGFWWCLGHALGLVETQKEYQARINTELNWLVNNVAQSPGQVAWLRHASAPTIDQLYGKWDQAIRDAQCPWYSDCDEVPQGASAFHRVNGALVLYRGGSSLTPKAGEFKVDANGNVTSARGVSVNADPTKVGRFGGAYEIQSLPPELMVKQVGLDPGHFEIVPREPMTIERFFELLGKIEIEGPKD